MKNKVTKLILAIAIVFTAFACEVESNNEEIVKLPTIVDIAKADPDLSSLVRALTVTGLASTFTAPGSYTVFTPPNAAFTAAGVTTAYLDNIEKAIADSKLPSPNTVAIPAAVATQIADLKLILQYHVLGLATRSEDLLPNPSLNFSGYSRTFGFYKSSATATSGANLSIFVDNVGADVLINGGLTNGGSKVTRSNIIASNGIVHKIENVLALPTVVSHVLANPKLFSTLKTILTGTATTPGTYGDQSAVLGALVAAVGQSNTTSVSVYAPTNAAFDAATGTGGYLTNATFFGTPALIATNVAKVLKYHYQAGNFPAATATSFSAATATSDQDVNTNLAPQKFRILRGTLKIVELPLIVPPATPVPAANAKVLNIQGTNGVVFAIDRVLQPVL